MRTPLHTTVDLARHFGPSWLWYRAAYAVRRRTGLLRRSLPAMSWEALPLSSFLTDTSLADPEQLACWREAHCTRFLWGRTDRASLAPILRNYDYPSADAISRADAICNGTFRCFEYHDVHLGEDPDWHCDPLTQTKYPTNQHWSMIGDFELGDIKLVWELSRFAWVYPLVRAYWRTGDDRYPRRFWQLVELWYASNPPQQGVHWKCGQEIAVRVMALCFGLYGFADSPATHPRRIALLTQLLAVCGQRLSANLDYALSQRNNHGILEGIGLWTIGLLFPELKSAGKWAALGRESMETQACDLVDGDGVFSQYSVNYQRVMLHACLWALRLGAAHGLPLSEDLRERVALSGSFLHALMEHRTGQLPRYGQNDGALILPLSRCEADDYRPVIQSASQVTTGQACLPLGPWNEETLWLCGAPPTEATPADTRTRDDWHAATSGLQVLRSESGHLFTRAGVWRHRPSHADMLHADIWWRGINIALDPGTYSYNAPAPWNNPLAGTSYHNTVTVDGHDQMHRAGRFLWLPWIRGRRTACETSEHGMLTYWEGTHDGYERLPVAVSYHRAILRIGAEHWLVLDRLHSRKAHVVRLHWLLVDAPFHVEDDRRRVELQTDAGRYAVQIGVSDADCAAPDMTRESQRTIPGRLDFRVVRGDPASPRGWQAPHYSERQPAISLTLETVARSVCLWTLLGPADSVVESQARRLLIESSDLCATVELSSPDVMDQHLIRCAETHNPMFDELRPGNTANSPASPQGTA